MTAAGTRNQVSERRGWSATHLMGTAEWANARLPSPLGRPRDREPFTPTSLFPTSIRQPHLTDRSATASLSTSHPLLPSRAVSTPPGLPAGLSLTLLPVTTAPIHPDQAAVRGCVLNGAPSCTATTGLHTWEWLSAWLDVFAAGVLVPGGAMGRDLMVSSFLLVPGTGRPMPPSAPGGVEAAEAASTAPSDAPIAPAEKRVVGPSCSTCRRRARGTVYFTTCFTTDHRCLHDVVDVAPSRVVAGRDQLRLRPRTWRRALELDERPAARLRRSDHALKLQVGYYLEAADAIDEYLRDTSSPSAGVTVASFAQADFMRRLCLVSETVAALLRAPTRRMRPWQ
jgi:hypothetical protein